MVCPSGAKPSVLTMVRPVLRVDGQEVTLLRDETRRRRLDVGRVLPRGRALGETELTFRHRVLCGLLGLHVPVVLVAAAVTGHGEFAGLPAAALLSSCLFLALRLPQARAAACSVAIGLLLSSAALVHLTQAGEELHVHVLLMVTATALYQDRVVFGLALGWLATIQGAAVAFGDTSTYGHEGGPWGWVLLHAAFTAVAAGVLLMFWRADERVRDETDRLHVALYDGRTGVEARLAEAERIRGDLIATVSHEFRTPLTGIRGAALTLQKRGDRLPPAARVQLLNAVVDQTDRLSRLLENMLIAASATRPEAEVECDVGAVATEVVALARDSAGSVSVLVAPGTRAHIGASALHQVLDNLLDNARRHGVAHTVPLLAAGTDGDEVWVTISNEGAGLDPTLASHLFEPFTQLASGPTRDREGLGMGLYVVRRLLEVHGGRVAVRSLDGWITVELRLPAAGSGAPWEPAVPEQRDVQTPVPTALPMT